MPYQLQTLTPNLIVADVARSVAFYCLVLGFTADMKVPDEAPFVFASVKSGSIEVFFNAPEPAMTEYPAFRDRPIGGTLTIFIAVADIHDLYASVQGRAPVVMPLEKKWYGVTEFAISDPDGYVLTFAEK
jgi:uncharacterized glyoxalase superfamily protein PhnB